MLKLLAHLFLQVYLCVAILHHLQRDILRETQRQRLVLFLKVNIERLHMTSLVFQFKRILIRLFCLEQQHGRHGFYWVGPWRMSANALLLLAAIVHLHNIIIIYVEGSCKLEIIE
jgi:hypothetical protein